MKTKKPKKTNKTKKTKKPRKPRKPIKPIKPINSFGPRIWGLDPRYSEDKLWGTLTDNLFRELRYYFKIFLFIVHELLKAQSFLVLCFQPIHHIDAEIHEFVLERLKFFREREGLPQLKGIVFVGQLKEIVLLLKPIRNIIKLTIVRDPTIQKFNEYDQLLLVYSSVIDFKALFIFIYIYIYNLFFRYLYSFYSIKKLLVVKTERFARCSSPNVPYFGRALQPDPQCSCQHFPARLRGSLLCQGISIIIGHGREWRLWAAAGHGQSPPRAGARARAPARAGACGPLASPIHSCEPRHYESFCCCPWDLWPSASMAMGRSLIAASLCFCLCLSLPC